MREITKLFDEEISKRPPAMWRVLVSYTDGQTRTVRVNHQHEALGLMRHFKGAGHVKSIQAQYDAEDGLGYVTEYWA